MASLTLVLILVAGVTVILFESLYLLLVAWLGMAIAVLGVSRLLKPAEHRAWVAVVVLGLGLLIGATIGVAFDAPLAVAGIVVALVAIGFLGSYALRFPAPVVAHLEAKHPVLLVNPKSGGGKATKTGLADVARERGIDVRVLAKEDDLTEMARQAIADGADAIGMAGGDGSLGYVATAAIEAGVPFICIPAGTRNHFARDIGLDRSDVIGALAAFDGEVRVIDHASVNGRVFVNVASLGLYATIVSDPAYRDAKAETTIATMQKLEDSGGRFDLQFEDGEGDQRESADLVMVSNNAYTISGLLADVGKRTRLDRGALGVLMLEVRGRHDLTTLATLYAAGQISRFKGWSQWDADEFVVGSGDPIALGVDGETLSMEPPLRFEIHPASFTIAVPPGTPSGPGVNPLSQKHGLSSLWNVAAGG